MNYGSSEGLCNDADNSVVVGEIGDSGTWSMDAVGETPNIAARLQTLAAEKSSPFAGQCALKHGGSSIHEEAEGVPCGKVCA